MPLFTKGLPALGHRQPARADVRNTRRIQLFRGMVPPNKSSADFRIFRFPRGCSSVRLHAHRVSGILRSLEESAVLGRSKNRLHRVHSVFCRVFANRRWTGSLALAAAVLSVCGSSSTAFAATPLLPGTQLVNPAAAGTSYNTALPAWITPANLIASQDAPLSQDFGGTLTSRVYYLDDGHNPLQGLGFTYVFHVTRAENPFSGTPTALDGASFSDLGWENALITDAGSDASGSSHGVGSPALTNGQPLSLRRFPDGRLKINWDGFDGAALWAGDTSALIFFATNQPGYQVSHVNLFDSGAIGIANTYAPSSVPAPEPASLMLIALAAVALKRRH